MALFFRGRGRDAGHADRAAELTALVRRVLDLPEAAVVSISEVACADPDCGGGETVVLVMRPGRKTAIAKVKKALRLVTDAEVEGALEGVRP